MGGQTMACEQHPARQQNQKTDRQRIASKLSQYYCINVAKMITFYFNSYTNDIYPTKMVFLLNYTFLLNCVQLLQAI